MTVDFVGRGWLRGLAGVLICALPVGLWAQASSSSSSSSSTTDRAVDNQGPVARPRAAQVEKGGAAVTLETSEPLFQLIAGLNACGYDADLDKSAPVRAKIRAEMNEALAGSEEARASRDALCNYVRLHHQARGKFEIEVIYK